MMYLSSCVYSRTLGLIGHVTSNYPMSLYGYLIKIGHAENLNGCFEVNIALGILEGDGDQRSSGV